MANSVFAKADLYVDDEFVGSHEECSITFTGNGEQLITAEGVFESVGVVTTEANIKRVVAKDGTEVDLTGLVISQKNVVLAFSANGKFYNVFGRLNRDQITSTVKSGVVKGDANFRGGSPIAVSLVF